MTFPSGPEHASYIALCRELRLPFSDDEAWQLGSVFEGDPGDLFFAGEQSAEGGQWPTPEAVFVPRLDQLLVMLEEATVEFVEIGVAWIAPDEALAELAAEGHRDQDLLRLRRHQPPRLGRAHRVPHPRGGFAPPVGRRDWA